VTVQRRPGLPELPRTDAEGTIGLPELPRTDAEGTIGLPELAELLGVHYMTAYRYVRTGRLEATLVRGSWRIDSSEVRRFQDTRGTTDARRPPGARPPAGSGSGRRRGGITGSTGAAAMLERRLVAGDERGSFALCEAALASWATPGEIYTDMLVPAMRNVGDRWQRGELSVADEHRATATALRLTGHIGPLLVRRGRRSATVVVGSVSGDHHVLPSVVVSDLLRAAGYQVAELGADTPPEAFVAAALHAERLVAVALGATLTSCTDQVATTVRALHAAIAGVPVIAGGAGVTYARTARASGAELCSGGDGRRVVELVDDLTGRGQAGVASEASLDAGHIAPEP